MAAYAVMSRIERVEPHLAGREHELDLDSGKGSVAPTTENVVAVEVLYVSEPGPIAERLLRMQELWRQTTFFLFDAESWRT